MLDAWRQWQAMPSDPPETLPPEALRLPERLRLARAGGRSGKPERRDTE